MDHGTNTERPLPPIDPIEYLGEEWAEWAAMTPRERWDESSRLWDHYLSLGGSLDPEPDPQSPFFDPDEPGPLPAYGRSGVHIVRRGGV